MRSKTLFQESLLESISLRICYPDRLFGLIDLGLVLPFHLDGREKEFCGVGIDRPLDQLDMTRHVGCLASW